MRKKFDIKYRLQIESGEYKMETEDGNPAVVMDWDWNHYGKHSIAVKVTCEEKNLGYLYSDNGDPVTLFAPDLFLVTPEPELTPFEEKLIQFSDERNSMECDNLPEDREGEILADHLHRKAEELIALARKQLQPEIDAMLEDVYKTADEVQYRKGREEALKDLPRWKKDDSIEAEQYITVGKNGERFHYKGHSLLISDLTKLPGFKEEE